MSIACDTDLSERHSHRLHMIHNLVGIGFWFTTCLCFDFAEGNFTVAECIWQRRMARDDFHRTNCRYNSTFRKVNNKQIYKYLHKHDCTLHTSVLTMNGKLGENKCEHQIELAEYKTAKFFARQCVQMPVSAKHAAFKLSFLGDWVRVRVNEGASKQQQEQNRHDKIHIQ